MEAGAEAGLVEASVDTGAVEDAMEASDALECPACDGACPPRDPHNCGGCGRDCTLLPHVTPAVSCSPSGACALGSGSCASGWADCNGDPSDGCETDVTTPEHCGGCGIGCPQGQTCSATGGSYACACPPNTTLCNGMCLGVDPTVGVFAAVGGASTGCGSMNNPCGSINSAIAAAGAVGRSLVYISSGTYNETVVLSSSVTLQGGWTYTGGSWQPICSGEDLSSAVAIRGVDGGGVIAGGSAGVVVTAGSPTLQALTVQSKPAADPGESLYGVFATGGGQVTLTNVGVQIAAGGAGASGAQGTAGGGGMRCQAHCAESCCPTGTCCAPGTGAAGTPGAEGHGGGAGQWTATGYVPSAGTAGTSGANGSAGVQPQPGPAYSGVVYQCPVTDQSWACVAGKVSDPIAGTGSAGSGGGGGGAGAPGQGGGSSVAIYAWGTQVMAGGAFTVGAGGNGGDGGVGGKGGPGTTGRAGTNLYFAQACGLVGGWCAVTENAGTTDSSKWVPLVKGSPGTTGGGGGYGGQGGGGAGGSSVCFFQSAGGSITGATSSCNLGSAGLGGDAGGGVGQGQNGVAGVSLSGPS